MGGQQAAILLVGVAHVLAAIVLLWMLSRSGDRAPGLGFWFGPDPGDEPATPPEPVAPGGAALPLPDAQPSAARLRGPGRLADAHPRRPRRPDHAPGPARTPDRS